jgi:hypothetical protein
MALPQVAPYGAWKSPISAAEAFAKAINISDLRFDGDTLYWNESRPDGRSVIVCRTPDGEVTDVTPPGYNVRTSVHEYGGAPYIVADGTVYFSNFADQRLYRQRPNAMPEALTTLASMRYADASIDRPRGRLLLVREDHTTSDLQPMNTIVSVDLENGDNQRILLSGNDFYSNPRLNADGTRLAWLTWNHPNMPWDSVELWVGEVLADGSIGQQTRIAGETPESLFQPEWSPDGSLYFVAERTGWWNLYRWREEDGEIKALHPMAAEFGIPQWVFGSTTYALASAGQLVCSYIQNGIAYLALLDTQSLKLTPFDLPYTTFRSVNARAGEAFFVGGSAITPNQLLRLDLATG